MRQPFPASSFPTLPLSFMPSFSLFSLCFLSFLLFGLVSASHISNRNHLPGLLVPRTRDAPRKISRRSCRPSPPTLTSSCFPALGFQMPSVVPNNTNGWWCNPADEYAFMGFSYEITSCEFLTSPYSPGLSVYHSLLSRPESGPATKGFRRHPIYLQQSLRSPIRGMRQCRLLVGPHPFHVHNTAYPRSCSNDIITAAWDNTLGIHALVWVCPCHLNSL